MTLSTLDKITSGANQNPKLSTLQAIARVLGCTLDDFDDVSTYMAVIAGLEARLNEKYDRIKHRAELLDHEQERSGRSIERETRRANRATLAACIIGALFIIFIFVDILWPTHGWIIR